MRRHVLSAAHIEALLLGSLRRYLRGTTTSPVSCLWGGVHP